MKAQEAYAEIWAEVLSTNRYLKIALGALSLLCVALLLLCWRTFDRFEHLSPLVVRIDEVGHAEAVNYEAVAYRPDVAKPEVKYFLRRFASEFGLSTVGGIQPDALEWLEQQRWPGNVRQLENVVRQALLAAREFPISVETLETVCKSKASDQTTAAQPLSEVVRGLLGSAKDGKTENVYNQALERLEQELFSQAIRLANGNQAKAARWLNVSRQTMREKLKKFGIYETLNQSDESEDSK